MIFARWSDDLLTGHPLIDEQHRRWYGLVNALHEAIVAGPRPEVIGRALQAVHDYTQTHFEAEEGIMRVRGYPAFGNHKTLHDALTRQVVELVTGHSKGRVLPIAVGLFLGRWLRDHIETADKRFFDWLKTAPLV